jgi:hypothetical protein
MDLPVFVGDVKEELRPVFAPVVPLVGEEESLALGVDWYPRVPVEYSEENGGSPSVVCVLGITLAHWTGAGERPVSSRSRTAAFDRTRRFCYHPSVTYPTSARNFP